MNNLILKEYLKETIDGVNVKAALFYTFNFEIEFFENYLLPLFLPEVDFTQNTIANSILWRQYHKKLPPVTVYCDFHSKDIKLAPSLNYEVRSIDIKGINSTFKPCFHPKVSLILLEDGRLIVINGSNNLTYSGWAENIEAVSVNEIKNGVDSFPREFKDSIKKFMDLVLEINPQFEKPTKAELELNEFFRQRLYMKDEYHNSFVSSLDKSFWDVLEHIKSENAESSIDEMEIISPYFSIGTSILRKLKEITGLNNIKCLIPYQGIDEVGITEELYQKMEDEGIVWSEWKQKFSHKGFRFNHSKIYRLKINNSIYTIIGSFNFTESAFNGFQNNGNVETAIVLKDQGENWEPLLVDCDESLKNKLTWSTEIPSEEKLDEHRSDIPYLSFVLNWENSTLTCINHEKHEVLFVFKEIQYSVHSGSEVVIKIEKSLIQDLADNSLIEIKYEDKKYIYYAIHENIEYKPLSSKLSSLSDTELLKIWENIDKEDDHNEIEELILKYIRSITNEAGDLVTNKEFELKSSLNTMASHLSGLIGLENSLFNNSDKKQNLERIKYYLLTDNLDTLIGYRKLLKQLYENNKIFSAFYWLVLKIIEKNFYKRSQNQFLHNEIYKEIVLQIQDEYTEVQNKMLNSTDFNINKNHLIWAEKILNSEY